MVERDNMTPERWQRLKQLYDDASDLPEEEWGDFIASRCSGDDELASALRGLLGNTAASSGLLDVPVATLLPSVALPAEKRTFAVGEVIDGRFAILQFLGKGGMGEVYKAYDQELQEHVALKTIRLDAADPQRLLERLRHEVRRSRRIAHPNVCRVYDLFGHSFSGSSAASFVTMQLLEGPTLAQVLRDDGPLQPGRVLLIAKQILGALKAAHNAGIVHRDLKPGNVILVDDGGIARAVVTDFGLAIELPKPGLGDETISQTLAGTPSYMAPEQFRGVATPASDLYAFGVLLFEVFTRVTPDVDSDDKGQMAPSATAIRRLQHLPAEWRNIILRCLEPSPDKRFASVDEILQLLEGGPAGVETAPATRRPHQLTRRAALGGVAAALGTAVIVYAAWNRMGPHPAASRLLVLPFQAIGDGADAALLADGITDSLIDDLSRTRLRVIAHGSAFHYKGRPADMNVVSRELGVQHVLSGTLEILNGSLRLLVSLLAAPGGGRIWSKQYTGSVNSIISFQDDIVNTVAAVLTGGARPDGPAPQELSATDLESYKLYLKGRYEWSRRSEAGLRQAIECFREVIGMDPANKRAYCGLADCYALLGLYGYASPNDAMPEAKMAAERALSLDNSLAEAYASLGLIAAVYDWDWPRARASLSHAIELDPSYVTARDWYAFSLAWLGEAAEAREQIQRAQQLDPLSILIASHAGWLAFWSRDYARAETQFRHAVALNPNGVPELLYAPLAITYAQQSRYGEAIATIEAGRKLYGDSLLADAARIYALAGQRGTAEKLLAQAEVKLTTEHAGLTIAMACEALKDRDRAFEWLYKTLRSRSSEMSFIKVDPRLDGLRSDPRFQDLLRKVHFIA